MAFCGLYVVCLCGNYYVSPKKHRGGSMRVTVLPMAIIITKAHRVTGSMMAIGSIVA